MGATDPDTADLTYSIDRNDDDMFSMDVNTGQIRLAADQHLNFEIKSQYNIRVAVSDGYNVVKRDFVIDVVDENDQPVIDSPAFLHRREQSGRHYFRSRESQ